MMLSRKYMNWIELKNTLIDGSLFLGSGFDSSEVEKSAQVDVFVFSDSRSQRLLLAVDGDLHVGRVELGLDVVPLAVVDQDVASQLDDTVTLQIKSKVKIFFLSFSYFFVTFSWKHVATVFVM